MDLLIGFEILLICILIYLAFSYCSNFIEGLLLFIIFYVFINLIVLGLFFGVRFYCKIILDLFIYK
jgi:hypothetical protein